MVATGPFSPCAGGSGRARPPRPPVRARRRGRCPTAAGAGGCGSGNASARSRGHTARVRACGAVEVTAHARCRRWLPPDLGATQAGRACGAMEAAAHARRWWWLRPARGRRAKLSAATGDFSDENRLGKGGFGPVYKGRLGDGAEITVKRLAAHFGQGLEEFKNEIQLIAKLQHTNLVRLLGCCVQDEEKMLVYEYVPNRSLDGQGDSHGGVAGGARWLRGQNAEVAGGDAGESGQSRVACSRGRDWAALQQRGGALGAAVRGVASRRPVVAVQGVELRWPTGRAGTTAVTASVEVEW